MRLIGTNKFVQLLVYDSWYSRNNFQFYRVLLWSFSWVVCSSNQNTLYVHLEILIGCQIQLWWTHAKIVALINSSIHGEHGYIIPIPYCAHVNCFDFDYCAINTTALNKYG